MNSALIIGATSDVGKAIATEYATQGFDLVLTGRDLERVDQIAADLRIRFECSVSTFFLDIADYLSHSSFIDSLESMPENTVCLVGYLGDTELALSEWAESERIIERNFTGVVSLINQVSNRYVRQQKGRIAVFSSVAGERGRASNFLYGSAKAGLTAYLSGLRNKLHSKQIHILTVKPGFIATKMTESLDLPALLTASAEQVAVATVRALKKKRNTLYVLGVWKLIMLIIRNIPESIFKKLNL